MPDVTTGLDNGAELPITEGDPSVGKLLSKFGSNLGKMKTPACPVGGVELRGDPPEGRMSIAAEADCGKLPSRPMEPLPARTPFAEPKHIHQTVGDNKEV